MAQSQKVFHFDTIHLKKDAQGRDLAPIFGDLSQSEKLSEIKPPLARVRYSIKRIKCTTAFF